MRKLLPLLLLLLPGVAAAQPFNAQVEVARGRHKPFTTALLPAACYPGMEAWDSTVQATKVCLNDGVTWALPPGGGGTTLPGCNNQVVFGNNTGVLTCEAALGYNTSDDSFVVGGSIGLGTTATAGVLLKSTVQTPDAAVLALGTVSRSLNITVNGNQATDLQNGPCGAAACAAPVLTVFGLAADSPSIQYNSLGFAGTMGRAITAINDAAASAVVQVPVPQSSVVGGNIDYTVFVSNATPDFQAISGVMAFAAENKAGTVACTTAAGTQTAAAVSAGTLTCVFTCAENPADTLEIRFNCDTSLTGTSLAAWTQTHLIGAGQITPQ